MTRCALTRKWLLPTAAALACLAASPASAVTDTGGAGYVSPEQPSAPPPTAPAQKATLLPDGRVLAPAGAPRRVKRVIAAANRIIGKPYRYGGGHGVFSAALDSGYDCSGSVSYALWGGRFLKSPLPSGSMTRWGRAGRGRWITVYAHGGHAYAVIAGMRFDTGFRDKNAPTRSGPAWSKRMRPSSGNRARHPRGY